MSHKRIICALAVILGASLSPAAYAWFFIFPIPNLSKPAPLNALIDALEKSEETKALAYVSDDKTFGSKFWVWGHYSGHVTQDEADRIALNRCQASLAKAKSQRAGGKDLYDFGTKVCELHVFVNKAISPLVTEQQRTTAAPTTQPTPPSPTTSEQAPIEQRPQAAPVVLTQEKPVPPAATPASAPLSPSESQPERIQATQNLTSPPPTATPATVRVPEEQQKITSTTAAPTPSAAHAPSSKTDEVKTSEKLTQLMTKVVDQPSSSGAWSELARQYAIESRYPESVKAYKQSLKLDATKANIWYELGAVYNKQGYKEGVDSVFQELKKRDRNLASRFFSDFVLGR